MVMYALMFTQVSYHYGKQYEGMDEQADSDRLKGETASQSSNLVGLAHFHENVLPQSMARSA